MRFMGAEQRVEAELNERWTARSVTHGNGLASGALQCYLKVILGFFHGRLFIQMGFKFLQGGPAAQVEIRSISQVRLFGLRLVHNTSIKLAIRAA